MNNLTLVTDPNGEQLDLSIMERTDEFLAFFAVLAASDLTGYMDGPFSQRASKTLRDNPPIPETEGS